MPAGAPLTYTQEILDKARGYLDAYHAQGDVVPQIAGLAVHIGKSRETIYEWAKLYPEFSDVVDQVMINQQRVLINGGLSKEFSNAITALMLAKHGFVNKQEVDVVDKTPTPERRKSRINELLGKCKS